ncbi:nitroreductase family protein [Spirochaeta cellobiosiphila]|uniref:nitroreductase family protein n=1 Tax=Spirochaeta cellobiosiphila TaxID=504483 RepID=UPI00040BA7CC|nr:nitroreductase family protein [Spirochaeta cellobiosiphila]
MGIKTARTDHHITSLLQERWSPRSFWEKPLAPEDFDRLLEAARWAPSSFNEQPWRFYYAHRDTEGFDKIWECLKKPNQDWARRASVLMIASAHTMFGHSGKDNNHAVYDLGQSVFSMTIQAESMGIKVHQMAGFYPDKAVELLNIPSDIKPITAIAIGYNGPPERLMSNLQGKETEARARMKIEEFSFRV